MSFKVLLNVLQTNAVPFVALAYPPIFVALEPIYTATLLAARCYRVYTPLRPTMPFLFSAATREGVAA